MRSILFIVFSLFIAGCSSEIDKLIPDTEISGAAEYFNYEIEVQKGKSVSGGILVHATEVVPFNISRARLRPTLLKAVKDLKKINPNCEWIVVWFYPDIGLVNVGAEVGKAEYKEGELNLYYNIPSVIQMSEWNKNREGNTPELFVPDREMFNEGRKLLLLYKKIRTESVASSLKEKEYKEILSEEEILHRISKDLDMKIQDVEKQWNYIHGYYGYLGRWGTENIRPQQ